MALTATASLGLFAFVWTLVCLVAGAVVFDILVPGTFSRLFPPPR